MPRTIFTGTVETTKTIYLEQGQELTLSRNGFNTRYIVVAAGYYDVTVHGDRIVITRIGISPTSYDLWRE